MSRNLSPSAYQAIHASETDEAFLILLTIDHEGFSQPIRVSSDAVDTISREENFVTFPFELNLPDDREGQSPRASLIIDNVSREIVQALRNIDSAPTVLMEIVCGSDTNIVEASFPDFKLINVKYNALTIQGELTIEDFSAEPYPSGQFSPADFPSLF